MTDVDTQQIRRTNGPGNSPWRNEALCERVHALWSTHSATQIAEKIWLEFRVEISRNSVVGYLHRQKLTVADKAEVHPQTRSDGIKRPPVRPRPVRVHPFHRMPVVNPPLPSDFVDVVADPLNISFAEIEDWQCKSIVNDDMSAPLYCGHVTERGHHYCRPHRSLYYVPGKRNGTLRHGEIGNGRGGVFGRVA